MKIRNGFVSNSSSSSFIVIGNSDSFDSLPNEDKEKTLVAGKLGTTEFGWEPNRHKDIYSRINFCYLQILIAKRYNEEAADTWLKMLESCIKENSTYTEIEWKISEDYDSKYFGYIDHQSAYPTNTEMFGNKGFLYRFIFDKKSYVQTDNDNH